MIVNLLLSGPPRVGKTTTCRMIMDRANRNISGFVTEDIRHEGERVGFMVEFDNGESRVLSHVDMEGSDVPTVGKYGVDRETLEWVLGKMEDWQYDDNDLYILDEIGKMELTHEDFPEEVERLLDADEDVLATIPETGPEFVDDVRLWDDVREAVLTEDNREAVLEKLVELLDLE